MRPARLSVAPTCTLWVRVERNRVEPGEARPSIFRAHQPGNAQRRSEATIRIPGLPPDVSSRRSGVPWRRYVRRRIRIASSNLMSFYQLHGLGRGLRSYPLGTRPSSERTITPRDGTIPSPRRMIFFRCRSQVVRGGRSSVPSCMIEIVRTEHRPAGHADGPPGAICKDTETQVTKWVLVIRRSR
jgi:hypothetical protein